MVWNEAGRAPTVKHPTEQSARDEAERLATLNPGSTFHILCSLDECEVNSVRWKSGWINIPF